MSRARAAGDSYRRARSFCRARDTIVSTSPRRLRSTDPSGALVEITRRCPDLEVEGEMHADIALNQEARERIFPNSRLHGRANLLAFANLDAANGYFTEDLADSMKINAVRAGVVAELAHERAVLEQGLGRDAAPVEARAAEVLLLDAHEVARLHRLPGLHGDAGEEVPERVLQGQGRGQAGDAEPADNTAELERATRAIVAQAPEIVKAVDPIGVGVVCEARHLCMMSRGVEKPPPADEPSTFVGLKAPLRCSLRIGRARLGPVGRALATSSRPG